MANFDTLWNVGLDPRILREGTYGEFKTQGSAAFALEFYSFNGLKAAKPGAKILATPLEDSNYRIQAKVVFIGTDYWIIDFGVLAYCEFESPAALRVGDFVEGEIFLSVDSFFYFQYAAKDQGAPSLIYDWQVQEVIEVRTPLTVQSDDHDRNFLYPDHTREQRVKTPQTNASAKVLNSERMDYLLRVTPQGAPRAPSVPGLRP